MVGKGKGGVMDIQRQEFEDWYLNHHHKEIGYFDGEYYENGYQHTLWVGFQAAKACVTEWISVYDRLPDEGEEVLVHHYGSIVQVTKDKNFHGGFKRRNCYGWESVSACISHWMPKSIKLPESFHFYYEHDAKVAKEKAVIEAQEPSHD